MKKSVAWILGALFVALFLIGGPAAEAAVPALLRGLRAEDVGTERAAAQALEAVTGLACWMDLPAWDRWAQTES